MLAYMVHIGHLNLGNGTSDLLLNFCPELPCVRLGLSDGRPVITDMFVLTGDLAVVAAVAQVNIDN